MSSPKGIPPSETLYYAPRHLNMDFSSRAAQESIPTSLPQRPKNFNTYGKEATIMLNTFNVIKPPTIIVHQYDVSFTGDGHDYSKRVLLQKIWKSKAVQSEIGNNYWVWDGNKLAWYVLPNIPVILTYIDRSGKEMPRKESRIHVDLDDEDGKAPKAGKSNKHTVHLRHTRKVDFSGLNTWLEGKASWSSEYIDTINFYDHLMREGPSQEYTQIKKSFFQHGENRHDLGGGVEAFKGVFASLRPVLDDKYNKSLSVNVDVANGTFWRAQPLTRVSLSSLLIQVLLLTLPRLSVQCSIVLHHNLQPA